MTGPADEDVLIRVQMRNELSGPAAVVVGSIEDVRRETQGMSRDFVEADIAARRLRDAQLELAAADKLVAKTAEEGGDAHVRALRRQTNAMALYQNTLQAAHAKEKKVADERRKADEKWTEENLKIYGSLVRLGRRIEATRGFWGKLFKSMLSFKSLGIIGVLVAIAEMLMSLGAAAYAAVAGLTPLLGLVVAMPGALLAMGQALAVVKLAMNGFGQAVKDLSDPTTDVAQTAKDLGKLSQNAQAAANFMGAFNRGPFKQFKLGLQDRFFEQFNQGLEHLPSLLDKASGPLMQTANVIGNIAKRLIEFIDSPEFSSDLSTILNGNNQLLGTMGGALIHVTSFFGHLMALAMPFLQEMARRLAEGADNLDRWIHTTSGENAVIKFFKSTARVAHGTWVVLKNFAVGLYNIGKASHVMGQDMGSSLLDASKKFREWTGSVEGQKKITKFFKDMIPVLHQTLQFFGFLGKAFFYLSQSDAGGGLVGVLLDLAKALTNLLDILRKAGIIGHVATLIAIVTKAIVLFTDALNKVPEPILKFIGFLLAMRFGWKAIVFLIPIVIDALWTLVGAAEAMGAAIAANPVLDLILLILAALAIIVIVVYKHWGSIKKFLISVWSSLNQTWNSFTQKFHDLLEKYVVKPVEYLLGIIRILKSVFITTWNAISSNVRSAVRAISNFIDKYVVNPIKTVVRWLKKAKEAWDKSPMGRFSHAVGEAKDLATGTIKTGGTIIGGITSQLPQQTVPGAGNAANQITIVAPGNKTRARWSGGPVNRDTIYRVAEKGPELFQSDKGSAMLNGPMLVKFTDPGKIIPNHLLRNLSGKGNENYRPRAKRPSMLASDAAQSLARQPISHTSVQVEGDRLEVTVNEGEKWGDIEPRLRLFWQRLQREKQERMIHHAGNPRGGK